MDPRRIEEFRRKLREGRPVRVVGGQVILNGATPEPQEAPAKPAPPAEGVQVKPHEWGALPFYTSAKGESRALKEQALLAREYPGFVMDVDDDGTPFAHGWLGPTSTLAGSYHVLLLLPPGYGQGVMPSVHLLEPRLLPGAPHVYQDGSLCLDHTSAFTRKSTLLTILAWVSVWLVLYEGWRSTGTQW